MTRALQASSSVRRSKIREHYRSAPVDQYAAVRAEMTQRLRREVSRRQAIRNALTIIQGMDELEDALLDGLCADPQYLEVL